MDLFVDGVIEKSERDERLVEIDKQLKAVEVAAPVSSTISIPEARDWLKGLRSEWGRLDQDVRRSLLLKIGAEVVVGMTRKEPTWIRFSCALPGCESREYHEEV